MIRKATINDLPGIEDALLRMKRRTEFVTVKVEFERGRKAVRQCISSPQGFCWVAERNGRISGVLLGLISQFWYSREWFASDLAFYSQHKGDGQALMARFLEWAKAKNAIALMGQSSGKLTERVRAFYSSFGLVPIGNLFIGEKPIAVQPLRRVG